MIAAPRPRRITDRRDDDVERDGSNHANCRRVAMHGVELDKGKADYGLVNLAGRAEDTSWKENVASFQVTQSGEH